MAKLKKSRNTASDPPGAARLPWHPPAPPLATALLISLAALLVRVLVSVGPYSGQGAAPKFGDYEAQRHWMELTLHLPTSDWYRNTSDNDLAYWGLDYPPLSAYQSLLHARLINASLPDALALRSSRGFESPESKLLMRWTVLSSDMMVFFLAALWFVWAYMKGGVGGSGEKREGWMWLLAMVLINPCLILVDHGHFQYNCISLGLTLGAIAGVLSRNELAAAALFTLAINHKQMSLYFAPAFLGHLLGKCLKRNYAIVEVMKLGFVVLGTFALVWWPYLHSYETAIQVISRLAPFERGIYEDYVANFWCSTSVLIKWKRLFAIKPLKFMSLSATILAFLPSFVQQVKSPSNLGFLYSLLNSSFSFYLFSYQVHEKSVLLPLLPASLLALQEPQLYGWFTYYALFSMYPLICRDQLLLQYIAVIGLFFLIYCSPGGSYGKGVHIPSGTKVASIVHFMAKPALIELIRSIVQAEGASTEQALSSALTSIMDALKSSDWTTRKTASLALSSIAVSSGYLVASFRTSCLRSLERCKFDKVKPVRDAITHAIQLWKAVPGSDTPEPSEAGSSTKENFFGGHHDARSIHDGGSRDTSFRKVDPAPSVSVISGSSITSVKKRSPLSVNKIPLNNTANQQRLKSSDWHVEISVPKQNMMPLVDLEEKGSGKVFMLKNAKRSAYEIIDEDSKSDYDPMDDKQDCSSVSEVASRSCETKHVTSALECTEHCGSTQVTELCSRARESKSIDSTVTDVTSNGTHACCLNAVKELAFIRMQLQEMERKQANLFDLLQEFMSDSVENMSVLNLKVHHLENAVDKTVYTITQSESRYHLPGSKFYKHQSASSSPRLSASTPRSSVDASYKPPPVPHLKRENKCTHDLPSKGTGMCAKEGAGFLKDHAGNKVMKPGAVSSDSSLGRYVPSSVRSRASGVKGNFPVSFTDSYDEPELQNALRSSNQAGEFCGVDGMDPAYAEALNCGDYDDLINLMDRTGPVLDKLSRETTNELLRVIAGHFINKKLFDLVLPWLQQVVHLSTIYRSGQLFVSVRAQREFISALEEAATSGSTEPASRIAIAQLAFKLTKVCEVGAPCRKISNRVCRGNESIMATVM